MIKQLKKITVNMIAGANVATVILMLLVGFAGYVNPANHPYLSCASLIFPLFLLINLGFLFFWLTFKWRMAFIPVAGYLLVLFPLHIYLPLNPQSDPPAGAIKVLSFNLQCYSGQPNYDDGFEPIFQYIKSENADIVCTQEDIDTWRNSNVRYDSLYAYNDTTHIGSMPDNNGVGIHTRYPILRKERIPYTSKGNGSVAYYLLIHGDTVLVINNHFESNHITEHERQKYTALTKGDLAKDTMRATSQMIIGKLGFAAAQRAPEADMVHRYIMSHRQYPMIVCGDFNDGPLSYTRHIVSQGLTDCYVTTGFGLGLSYNQNRFYVRIDNILCSSHFKPYQCHVDREIDASDHYPIICWLKKR
jgi:endonuclease/exonuclease/phosphatase family metal-dependent hydrolase